MQLDAGAPGFIVGLQEEHEEVETIAISNHGGGLPLRQAFAKLFDRLGIICADLFT